jgi:pimeloyl-ACP methyl ester carboxylesterase
VAVITGVTPAPVLFLPGSVLPAELAYGSLLAALAPEVDAVAKELEVYATPEPPPDYTLDLEVDGILREADARGWEQFHLAGYSGGGAATLAFTAHHPDRLLSLALLEPAWAGFWDLSPEEQAMWHAYDALDDAADDEFMAAFAVLGVKEGVALPERPPGDPPVWMANRPAGIRAFLAAFRTYDLDRAALQRFDRPVYYALGGLSNPDQYGEIAARLEQVFPDFELEAFEERHHFDPPHRIEPERLAASLRRVWKRAEERARDA